MQPAGSKTASRLVWAGLIGVLAIVAAVGVISLTRRRSAEALPVLGHVPAFSLTERSGRTVTNEDLRGSIWIADFVFTRCGGTCPLLSAQMARFQRQLGVSSDSKLRLVSFTVDPDYDTPEILRSYAARLHADPQGWLFLSGPHPAMYDLIKDGFHLSVAEREDGGGDPNEMITHSDRFVLIDREGAIRGYYHGDDEESVKHMLDDLAQLRRES